jgi:membrane protease YdiL (CAAX protease family)
VTLPAGTYLGWSWRSALVYAPASGVAQELFFRAALLPAMPALFPGRPRLALFGHAILFSCWHIGPLFIGVPLWAVTLVMLVSFIAALGWGWQVQHDKSMLWAIFQHSLIWVVGSPFSFGS